MSSKIYVGNLPFSVTDSMLRSNFSEFGDVSSAKVMMDRDTGVSKGFGFVEMESAESAQAAIAGLHGAPVQGRSIVVSLARPRDAQKREAPRAGGEFRATKRSDVGYGSGGFGGGRY
ncbi:MAG: RNA-binding protein [Mitsuaria chitosanitabida]|uniref:RNA recognition motif domain-containing protein n=1 Tax=Roseateles chitosanitabidus TaxID=65048 RepID=UPI001B244CEE|nr:RNA-binding protein [Roseateles chitosanitabidus]MBO9687068.1 RNA-binding protein [Roseateles chitosanitabidus]